MEAILLVGHGSRDPEGNAELLEFVEKVRERAPGLRIEACFLELTKPTIQDGISKCVSMGASKIVLVPVILLAAGHAKIHIPAEIDTAKQLYPHVEFAYGRPIGLHDKVLSILRTRLAEAGVELQTAAMAVESMPAVDNGCGAAPEQARDKDTAVLVLGRGSSDADSNGELFKITRFLWEQVPVKNVEASFIGVTEPSYSEGLDRCLRLGAKRIVVLPYFLFTGVLIKRIEEITAVFAAANPEVRVDLAGYFGFHPELIELVLERAAEAMEGRAAMNCDMCKYRLEASAAVLHHHHHDHEHEHEHGHENEHGHHHEHEHAHEHCGKHVHPAQSHACGCSGV
jgi:sirohydrochlorin cobaltochelatase